MSTYYELLGLAVDDPPQKIRARYRLLARGVHPDTGGHVAAFRPYAEAYRVLNNPARRARYNQQIGVYAPPRALHPGHDLYQRVQVSPGQAQRGGQVMLSFGRYEPCPRCWLIGCERCGGQGMLLEQVTVQVRIPPGTKDGSTVFVDGCGACREPGGSRGDLYVYVDLL